MEFKFNLNEIFQEPIVEIDNTFIPPGFKGDKRALWDTQSKVSQIINAMGEASASAQNLNKPITTSDRLRNSEHKLYVLIDQHANNGKGAVSGMLKIGEKGLYVFDRDGQHYQVTPPCVLDFYVHESRQRTGLGKHLFEHMLKKLEIDPVKMAIDRPSDKFLAFLNKHYNLNTPVKQMNNYVVFDGFFPKSRETSAKVTASATADDNSVIPAKSKSSANGLQQHFNSSPSYGRYGARKPPCSMGQIIHNDSAVMHKNQEPTGVQSAPATNLSVQQNYSQYPTNTYVTQSTPNMHYHQQVPQNIQQQHMVNQQYGAPNQQIFVPPQNVQHGMMPQAGTYQQVPQTVASTTPSYQQIPSQMDQNIPHASTYQQVPQTVASTTPSYQQIPSLMDQNIPQAGTYQQVPQTATNATSNYQQIPTPANQPTPQVGTYQQVPQAFTNTQEYYHQQPIDNYQQGDALYQQNPQQQQIVSTHQEPISTYQQGDALYQQNLQQQQQMVPTPQQVAQNYQQPNMTHYQNQQSVINPPNTTSAYQLPVQQVATTNVAYVQPHDMLQHDQQMPQEINDYHALVQQQQQYQVENETVAPTRRLEPLIPQQVNQVQQHDQRRMIPAQVVQSMPINQAISAHQQAVAMHTGGVVSNPNVPMAAHYQQMPVQSAQVPVASHHVMVPPQGSVSYARIGNIGHVPFAAGTNQAAHQSIQQNASTSRTNYQNHPNRTSVHSRSNNPAQNVTQQQATANQSKVNVRINNQRQNGLPPPPTRNSSNVTTEEIVTALQNFRIIEQGGVAMVADTPIGPEHREIGQGHGLGVEEAAAARNTANVAQHVVNERGERPPNAGEELPYGYPPQIRTPTIPAYRNNPVIMRH